MLNFYAALPLITTQYLELTSSGDVIKDCEARPNKAIELLRKILRKQKFPHTEIHEDGYQIFMASNEAYVKPGRALTKARKAKVATIICSQLESGRWQWTYPTGRIVIADYPHDEKRYNKIISETKAAITRRLREPMPDCYGDRKLSI